MIDPHEPDDSIFRPLLFREIIDVVVHTYRRNAWRLIAIAFVAQLVFFVVGSLAGDALAGDALEFQDSSGDTAGETREAGVVETPQGATELLGDEARDLGDLTDTSDPGVREALDRSDRSPDDALGLAPDTQGNLLGDVVVEQTSEPASSVFADLGDLEVNWLAAVVAAIIIWVALAVSEAAIIWVALESRLNVRAPLAVSMRRAFERLMPLALTTLVIFLIVLVVFFVTIALMLMIGPPALVLGVVAGVYLAVRLLFAPIIALVQRTGPSDSINESFRMTRGNWWMLAGYVLVMVAFYFVAGTALQFTVGLIPVIGDIVVGTVMVPPSIILVTVLYLDLRARTAAPGTFTKEVLAAELGLVGSGPESPTQ